MLRRLLRRIRRTMSMTADAQLQDARDDAFFRGTALPGPRARALKSVAEMRRWTAAADDPPRATVAPLQPRARDADAPRVILCHDMMGNFLADAAHQTDLSPVQHFTFHYWHIVDVFIYFSHDRCAIPPPQWIDTAHRHGVQVLGTFITEWDDGKKDNRAVLERDPVTGRFVMIQPFVDIMLHYQFDGWFFNVESALDSAEQAEELAIFLGELREAMHAAAPGSLLVWYDSVTSDGRLAWQNELNFRNKVFFDNTDAIFTNYTWKAHQPASSAETAGARRRDVYCGIDCFGRNTFGGGGFDAWKAVDVCVKARTSVAVFAPGWTWEVVSDKGRLDFFGVTQRLWVAATESIGALLAPHSAPGTSEFFTNFCRGTGARFFRAGRAVHEGRWCHLALQQPQPSWPARLRLHESPEGVDLALPWHALLSDEDAFEGGQSLQLRVGAAAGTEAIVAPLFKLQHTGTWLVATVRAEGTIAAALRLTVDGAPGPLLFGVKGAVDGAAEPSQSTAENGVWRTLAFDAGVAGVATELAVVIHPSGAPGTLHIGRIQLGPHKHFAAERERPSASLDAARTRVTWAGDGTGGHVFVNDRWAGFTMAEHFVLTAPVANDATVRVVAP